jgi:hypothetical protein
MFTLNKEKEQIIEGNPLIDLTFCFEEWMIIEEALNKLNYIGTYTVTNSASAMSKSIGQQIDKLMKEQLDLKNEFKKLIKLKTGKVDLVDQKEINQLMQHIKEVANQLKKSTNSICKSLAENPDIPLNLEKAKEDKLKIKIELEHIKEDLICGCFTMFPNIKDQIKRENVNIDELRKTEMSLFEKLRRLNDDLFKEQAEYDDDNDKLSKKLEAAKKELAKTKMEASILRKYRKNELDALQALKKTNFDDREVNLKGDIEERIKEKVCLSF